MRVLKKNPLSKQIILNFDQLIPSKSTHLSSTSREPLKANSGREKVLALLHIVEQKAITVASFGKKNTAYEDNLGEK